MHRKRIPMKKTITILTDYLGLGKIDMKIRNNYWDFDY